MVDAVKRLLLVVDYQKDFVDGALGFPGAEALDGPIAAKIAACRAAGDDVAFTLDTHGPDYLDTQEGRKLPVPHCLLNSEGWQLYGQTGQAMERSRDMVIGKGAFPSLWLANWLKEQGYDRVELAGLVSYLAYSPTPSWSRPPCPRRRSWWMPPAPPGPIRISTPRAWM